MIPTPAKKSSLGWDNRLARIAKSRANQCIFSHDCTNCRTALNIRTNTNGQNIYMQTGFILS